jgi:hypothetical protein
VSRWVLTGPSLQRQLLGLAHGLWFAVYRLITRSTVDYVHPLLLPFGSHGLGAWAQLSSSNSLLCVRGGLPADSELAQLSSVMAPASNWELTKLRVAVRDSSMFMLGPEEARGRVGRGGMLAGSTTVKAPVSGLVLAPIGHQNSFNMIAWWQKRRHR